MTVAEPADAAGVPPPPPPMIGTMPPAGSKLSASRFAANSAEADPAPQAAPSSPPATARMSYNQCNVCRLIPCAVSVCSNVLRCYF
jgi:hypothetical protein